MQPFQISKFCESISGSAILADGDHEMVRIREIGNGMRHMATGFMYPANANRTLFLRRFHQSMLKIGENVGYSVAAACREIDRVRAMGSETSLRTLTRLQSIGTNIGAVPGIRDILNLKPVVEGPVSQHKCRSNRNGS